MHRFWAKRNQRVTDLLYLIVYRLTLKPLQELKKKLFVIVFYIPQPLAILNRHISDFWRGPALPWEIVQNKLDGNILHSVLKLLDLATEDSSQLEMLAGCEHINGTYNNYRPAALWIFHFPEQERTNLFQNTELWIVSQQNLAKNFATQTLAWMWVLRRGLYCSCI